MLHITLKGLNSKTTCKQTFPPYIHFILLTLTGFSFDLWILPIVDLGFGKMVFIFCDLLFPLELSSREFKFNIKSSCPGQYSNIYFCYFRGEQHIEM